MQKPIVVIGSINMDLVTYVNRRPEIGETITGNGFKQFPGGKGANQAIACARLGTYVQMIGRVGDDEYSKIMQKQLKDNNVETSLIIETDKCSTGIATIIVNEKGENSIIVTSGANERLTIDDIERNADIIRSASIVIAQLEIPTEVVEAAFEIAAKANVLTVLDPAPAEKLEKSLTRNTTIITPNETELSILTDVGDQDTKAMQKAADMLLDAGIKTVIITLGSKGACAFRKEGSIYQPAYPVKSVDTTAAGDGFTGALCAGLSIGCDLKEALKLASMVGSLTVSKYGAQASLPTIDEVLSYAKSVNEPMNFLLKKG